MEFTMTAPLSRDLRERIVRFVEGGASVRQAGLRFEVSPSAAIKLMQRVRKTGSTVPAKIGGYRKPILEPHAETLRAIVESNPGMTLKEMRDALHARGIVVKALSTISDMLHRLKLSYKRFWSRPRAPARLRVAPAGPSSCSPARWCASPITAASRARPCAGAWP